MKSLLKISFITLLLFILTDFLFGKNINEILESNNIYVTLDGALKKNIQNEKKFRIRHSIFSHTLKENYTGVSFFGSKMDQFCTNIYGFKSDCKNINNSKSYDYMFIGDSFTEGVGLSYDETFVGIFENYINSNVANLGVSSYSPIIYFYKLKYFLEKGLSTKNVIVYLDVSDLEDEMYRYECNGKVCNDEAKDDVIDFRETQNLYSIKKLIKKRLKFSTTLLQYLKKITCTNFLIKQCSYVYDQNFLKSSWINNFEYYSNTNNEYKKSFDQLIYYLDKIYYLSKEYDFNFSIAIYPWPGHILYPENIDKYESYWKNYCNNKCKYFINHFDDFDNFVLNKNKDEIVKSFYIYGDMHFNHDGNKILANKLKTAIQ